MKRKFCLILFAVAILAMMLCSCSEADRQSGALPDSYNGEITKEVISGDAMEKTEQKYVITARMDIESKDFEGDIKKITGWISELGGYVENLEESTEQTYYGTNTCRIKARIPVENLAKFKTDVEKTGNVTYKTENKENITDSYYEAESYYKSLKVQEERLMAIMENAETLDEILKLEESLAKVRQQISYYDTLLKTYDNKVEFATMDLTITSVVTYTEKETFGGRFAEAFKTSWIDFWEGCKDFVIWFIAAIPTLLVLGVIGLGIFFIVRGIIKKAKKKKNK